MKVNNTEVETVDWKHVTKNEGIYKSKKFSSDYLISLDGVVVYYCSSGQWIDCADDLAWQKEEFISLPNATLIFDVKE